MDSAPQVRSSFSSFPVLRPPSLLRASTVSLALRRSHLVFPSKTATFCTKASASGESKNAGISHIRAAACAVILATAAFGKFSCLHVRAAVPPPPTSETLTEEDSLSGSALETSRSSPMAQLLSSNPETMDALKKLLQEKLEAGEDEECLSMLKKLTAAQPSNLELKFLMARLLSEMGKTEEARAAFEDILSMNPLSFQALFENALLMDRSGERDSVMGRLEKALRIAESEKKFKEARDVKLIMAQMQFLQKNVDDAMTRYDELVKEDPSDFRPYFCKGMIFTLTDRHSEAKEEFAKYRQLSPKKFEVEGYLRTPLSRMKLWPDE